MLLRQLQRTPEPNHMFALYLTTAEIAKAGSVIQCQRNDLVDPNIHVIYWDNGELAVDTAQVQNGKIAVLEQFLENRRMLWLTLSDVDTAAQTERIIKSSSVESYLNSTSKFTRWLWIAVLLVAGILLSYYCYQWMQKPPAALPQVQPIILRR